MDFAIPQSEVDKLIVVLHTINGDFMRFSPKMRREWRGMAVRLARALVARGVRAP